MINNKTSFPVEKLQSQRTLIYEPQGEWLYSHHASITFFKGRFYAVWSNGRFNEDDLGQRVVLSVSDDAEVWEPLRPVVTPEMFGNPDMVLTAGGFHIHDDTLYLYYGAYYYDPATVPTGVRPKSGCVHCETDMGYISTVDGVNWSAPKSLSIPLVPNHPPKKTSTGRLIIAGNVMFPYTDNPNGIEGWNLTGVYGNAFETLPFVDDSAAIRPIARARGWNAELLCEGSFYETDDHVLHMMLRSNGAVLWHSFSENDGETWSEPLPTEFSDDGSKFHFGRLPDGRFYAVCNSVVKSHRLPLDLYLSSDGENFDRRFILRDEPYQRRWEGIHKGGHYGYPHTMLHDGFLYVIYSKMKECVEVTKVPLSEIMK